jgi:hypothetical protein
MQKGASISLSRDKKTHRAQPMPSPVQSLIKPQTGAQEIETLNKRQPQMYEYQCRNKHQGNSSPLKANSVMKDLNSRKEEEISNIEFQKIIIRMINELKEEAQKLVSKLKEVKNKKLKELNSNK